MAERRRPPRRQRGVALLTVLLVTALVTVLAVGMVERHRLAIARTRQVLTWQQSLDYALGAESHARALLRADLLEDREDPPADSLLDRWAEPMAPFEIPSGEIELRIRDLTGLLNLNATVDPAGRDRLRRLLDALGLDPTLADAVADWIDEDLEPSGAGGAEDGAYLLAAPAHRSANRELASVTELRLLPGVDEETWLRLLPFVAALPGDTRRINVNTAPGPVLAALAPGMTPERAAAYAFPEEPWSQAGELVGREAGFAPELGMLTVRSRFFEVLVRAEHDGRTVTLRSRIHRDPETAATTVLDRDLGQRYDAWIERTDPGTPEEDE